MFQLVTATRRHQRSFSSDINNMALSVFFVALGCLSLLFLYIVFQLLAARRIYGLFQAVSFEPRTRRCGGAKQVIISSFHCEINHLITRTSRANPSSLSVRPPRRREKPSTSQWFVPRNSSLAFYTSWQARHWRSAHTKLVFSVCNTYSFAARLFNWRLARYFYNVASQYFAAKLLNWRLWEASVCNDEETGQQKAAAVDPEG